MPCGTHKRYGGERTTKRGAKKGYVDKHGWWRPHKPKGAKRVHTKRVHARKSGHHVPGRRWVTGPYKSVKGARSAQPRKGHVKKWGKRYYKVWRRK